MAKFCLVLIEETVQEQNEKEVEEHKGNLDQLKSHVIFDGLHRSPKQQEGAL